MLNFAIIGAGASVFRHHRAALEKLPGRIVALADVNTTIGKQRAHELDCAFYTKYQTMLREIRPDVAVILTPPSLHASIAIACLRAGCHVLVEKPMALEIREADTMIEVAAQCQRMLGVVFQQRFDQRYAPPKLFWSRGRLGRFNMWSWPRTVPGPRRIIRPYRGGEPGLVKAAA